MAATKPERLVTNSIQRFLSLFGWRTGVESDLVADFRSAFP